MPLWRVTINKKFTYRPAAINSAEACSEAVRAWRKDDNVDPEARRQIVRDIHAIMQ